LLDGVVVQILAREQPGLVAFDWLVEVCLIN
jgi:hypothetical protein